jgi:GxxExxY protein
LLVDRLARANELTAIVINAGLALHQEIGPGLLESVYEQVLADRLTTIGLQVDRQKPVSIVVDGRTYPEAFRYDLLVEDLLLIELKSIEKLGPIHGKQALTYIRLMNLPIGLVLNFGSETFKQGIRRITNNHWKA